MSLTQITCISDLYYVIGRKFTLLMVTLAILTLPLALDPHLLSAIPTVPYSSTVPDGHPSVTPATLPTVPDGHPSGLPTTIPTSSPSVLSGSVAATLRDPLAFLMCLGIVFVGCAAPYRDRWHYKIHYISASLSALTSIPFCILTNPISLLCLLLSLVSLLDRTRWLLWCELSLFLSAYTAILLSAYTAILSALTAPI